MTATGRTPEAGIDLTSADPIRDTTTDVALEAGGIGTWWWDPVTGRLQLDQACLRVFALPPGSAPSTWQEYVELVHPEDRAAFVAAGHRAVAEGGVRDLEHRLLLPDGSVRWVAVSSQAVRGPDGAPSVFTGVNVDVTERKLVEDRLAFLSRAGQVLGSSLDPETTFQQVCELAIERFADWCSIDLLDGPGVRLAAIAHRDPEKIDYARRLRERFPVDLSLDQGVARVLRTGRQEFLPDIDDQMLRAALAAVPEFTATDVEEFLGLGLRSSLVVPLRVPSGRIIGALTLVAEEGRRRFDDDDVTLAMEVAGRAAVAMENAQLYARIEHTAQTLQRSLLPATLPQLPFAEIAGSYRPLTALDLVGGDFYDVFETLAGRWCVTIGDVAGKGVDAAALTAAARWTLRAALVTDVPVDEALRQLNDHLVRHGWDERYVTILACVLEPAEGGLAVQYASGGHPPPVVRRADGSVQVLEAEGQPVGLFPGSGYRASALQLRPGDALLLYTDGLTDVARPADGAREHDWFDEAGLVAALQGAPPDLPARELLHRVTSAAIRWGTPRDDTAVIVLRAWPPLAGAVG